MTFNRTMFVVLLTVYLLMPRIGTKSYNPGPSFLPEYIEAMDKVLPGESLTGCLCPSTVNTKATFKQFCGKELTARHGNSSNHCIKEARYRCINGRQEGILFDVCEVGRKCVKKLDYVHADKCEDCVAHDIKMCH